ncbi:MAG: ribulose-phosphate 3-epimerase [Tenericutes bacterium]|nr:ribulose-phosphate 3-epimerase [Mycoplasmatota bacterium]
MRKVSVTFLSSTDVVRDLKLLDMTDTDYVHVDVMDGKFVPNKTMPFSEMKNIGKYTSKRLDIHLMVEDPSKYIPLYASLNAEYIAFHVEVDEDIEESLKMIRNYSIKAGLAIKPETKISELVPYLPYLDLVLVMSVEPGAGGQKFIEGTEDKINELRELLDTYHSQAVINVDGGINDVTCKKCYNADIVASGSYVVRSDNFQEKISSLR